MNKIIKLALFLSIGTTSQFVYASACTQNNNTLSGLVGLDSSSSTVYAKISSASNNCSCAHVRFTESNTDTKMVLSILLSAKMAEKKVRVDFLNETSCDTGYRAYIQ